MVGRYGGRDFYSLVFLGSGRAGVALGFTDENSVFNISYVGRSDGDLNDRLHDWEDNYLEFKYGFLKTSKAAFEKECRLYHAFTPPDNKYHPGKPDGTNYRCPEPTCPL